jgi:hypothetical protein
MVRPRSSLPSNRTHLLVNGQLSRKAILWYNPSDHVSQTSGVNGALVDQALGGVRGKPFKRSRSSRLTSVTHTEG